MRLLRQCNIPCSCSCFRPIVKAPKTKATIPITIPTSKKVMRKILLLFIAIAGIAVSVAILNPPAYDLPPLKPPTIGQWTSPLLVWPPSIVYGRCPWRHFECEDKK